MKPSKEGFCFCKLIIILGDYFMSDNDITPIVIDLTSQNKLNESWLRMFGYGIKSILSHMFGETSIPKAILLHSQILSAEKKTISHPISSLAWTTREPIKTNHFLIELFRSLKVKQVLSGLLNKGDLRWQYYHLKNNKDIMFY